MTLTLTSRDLFNAVRYIELFFSFADLIGSSHHHHVQQHPNSTKKSENIILHPSICCLYRFVFIAVSDE